MLSVHKVLNLVTKNFQIAELNPGQVPQVSLLYDSTIIVCTVKGSN